MKWFKFYGQDWLTDLKIRKLSVEDKLCFITLLCLASSEDKEGVVSMCDEDTLIQLTGFNKNTSSEVSSYTRAKGCLDRYEALHLVTRSRYGDVVVVNFSRRQSENLSNAERQKRYRDSHKIIKKSNVTQRNDSNARIEKITKVTLRVTESKKKVKKITTFNPLGEQIIFEFIPVNPACRKYYSNTTQRSACDRLIAEYGLERVKSVIALLPRTNPIPWIPTITTPLQLEDRWVSLHEQMKKEQAKNIIGKNERITPDI